MSNIYFLDAAHEENYKVLTTKIFPKAQKDSEYRVASYILALPGIYERALNDPLFPVFPFLWIKEYTNTSYTEWDEEDQKEYHITDFEIKTEDGQEVFSESFYTLSSGYQKLVLLAQNLFNGNQDGFNLCHALGTWDDQRFKLYMQAVQIRINRQISGLKLDLR